MPRAAMPGTPFVLAGVTSRSPRVRMPVAWYFHDSYAGRESSAILSHTICSIRQSHEILLILKSDALRVAPPPPFLPTFYRYGVVAERIQ